MTNLTDIQNAILKTVRMLADDQQGLRALRLAILDLDRKLDTILARLPKSYPGTW